MKKLSIIFLILISQSCFAGIDEMRNREPGMPPQYDNPNNNGNGKGNGNGNGNGNNPNVPIDDFMFPFIILVAIYAIYKMKTNNNKS